MFFTFHTFHANIDNISKHSYLSLVYYKSSNAFKTITSSCSNICEYRMKIVSCVSPLTFSITGKGTLFLIILLMNVWRKVCKLQCGISIFLHALVINDSNFHNHIEIFDLSYFHHHLYFYCAQSNIIFLYVEPKVLFFF